MSLIFMDGFDHYATADISKKWTSALGTLAISSANARRGSGGALRSTSTSGLATKTLAASAGWVTGFGISFSSLPTSGPVPVLALLDAGTLQFDLRINLDGTVSVTRNGTALTGGTSVVALSTTTYHYLELKVTIANSISAGSCKVRLNGADIITVATSQDTQNTANASANQIRLGTNGAGNTLGTVDFDDFYVCDLAGSTNNDFLGDVRIDTIFPTSDGNYSQFAPSTGTSHFALVDEVAPNTTDYNDGSTINDRDSYGMGNLTALTSQTVYAVQANAAIMKDDAGAKSAATFVRSSSTNGDGASSALSTSQAYISQVFETDPNGSIAWTETSVNAMEAGVKVTA
jgi:hypothetical protein